MRLPLNSEFSVAGSYRYDRSGPVRWILSHIWRNKTWAIAAVSALDFANALNSLLQWLIGRAFDNLLETPPDRDALVTIMLISGVTLSLGMSTFKTEFETRWSLIMAASVVFTLPMVILFFLAQRYFIEGISPSGPKG